MLMSPAGGLRYHWRALKHSKVLWAPFRQAVGTWLAQWRPPERGLILIGPSAGYCLNPEFLARFDQVVALEPDPIARALLPFRMKHPRLVLREETFFTAHDEATRLAGFQSLLRDYPDSAVLFCNLLGQLRLLVDDAAEDAFLTSWKSHLLPELGTQSWASFHDRYSGPLAPALKAPLSFASRPTDREMLDTCYSGTKGGELFDHLTEGFFPPNRQHSYFSWQLTPGHWHLVEGVQHSAAFSEK